MADRRRCPRCGATRDATTSASGPCPGCLLRLGLSEPPAGDAAGDPGETRPPSEPPPDATTVTTGLRRGREPRADPLPAGSLLPGTVLAGRYRIVGLVGFGGMAEVYRADDLRLGQPVALKFLPREADRAWMDRFVREVRLARQVTHPNICRIYDLQEAEGRPFISMEYIDGEDLASLLRRIGRLPLEKAIQIAGELCAGLSALHDREIVHRDLKPANVMIDGRGRARITDFGLAVPALEFPRTEMRAGTPGYMAPEQRAGLGVSVRSDVYSLGLVLYEVFTGQAAFPSEDGAQAAPRRPSDLVAGIDPSLDRIILRCLERRPADRPPSARAVATSLPGWEPLAAAAAAGETPSPEMLAEAGARGVLPPAVAAACAAAALLGLAGVVLLSGRTQLSRLVVLENPPAVLAKTARDLLADLGLPRLHGAASGFTYEPDLLPLVLERTGAPPGWRVEPGAPCPVLFWYSQGSARTGSDDQATMWRAPLDPPAPAPGAASLWLDPQGRLRTLVAFPPEPREHRAAGEPWQALLEAAGLDPASLAPATPARVPPVPSEARAAWSGAYPGGAFRIRAEAGAYRGTPVYFDVVPSIDGPPAQGHAAPGAWGPATGLLGTVWFLLALLGGLAVAVRNLRAGRGDRRGALRVATGLLLLRLGAWVLGGHHAGDISELYLFTANLAWGLWYFCLGWIWYVAMEPYARRLWPGKMVSWVRLLDGRLRDPLVGRDWLLGTLGGLGIALVLRLGQIAPSWLGAGASRLDRFGPFPGLPELRALEGMTSSLAVLLAAQKWALFYGFVGLVPLIVLRILLRSQWASVLVLCVLGAIGLLPAAGMTPVALLTAGAVMAGWACLVLFAGVLPMMVALFVYTVLISFPLTFDLTAWYAPASLLALAVVVVPAGWAFFTAIGARPIFRDDLFPARGRMA